jgi:hypothetical protein
MAAGDQNGGGGDDLDFGADGRGWEGLTDFGAATGYHRRRPVGRAAAAAVGDLRR